jgi:ankyrin repeat protein
MSELQHAVAGRKLEPVKQLLKRGIDPNEVGPSTGPSLTPLMLACCSHPEFISDKLWRYIRFPDAEAEAPAPVDNLAIVKVLLEAGASTNSVVHGLTPLLLAIRTSNPAVVEALLAAGADPSFSKSLAIGPVCLAIMCKHLGILDMLLAHGADPNETDARNDSVLAIAAKCRDAGSCGILLKHGADVEYRNHKSLHPMTPLNIAVNLRGRLAGSRAVQASGKAYPMLVHRVGQCRWLQKKLLRGNTSLMPAF